MSDLEDRPNKGIGSDTDVANLSPAERAAFERRLSELDAKLDDVNARKQAEIEAREDKVLRGRGMAYGLRMSSELVAAVVVGGLIGYGLDRWLDTGPWFFLVFFMVGFAAGILNVTRAFKRMQAEIAKSTGGDIGHSVPDDDDD